MADTTAPKTCGGFCCERFRIRKPGTNDKSMSLAEILKEAASARPWEKEELDKLSTMLIFLDHSYLNGNGEMDHKPSFWFTCKHFDKETRLCKTYETRPSLCRNHGPVQCYYTKCQLPKPQTLDLGDIAKKESVDDSDGSDLKVQEAEPGPSEASPG